MKRKRNPIMKISSLHKLLLVTFAFVGFLLQASAQQSKILAVDEFIEQVKNFHPIAKQAGIAVEKANANLLAARGGLDPFFEWNYEDKIFAGTNYYRYSRPEIKLPTITGISLKSGFEKTAGQYPNPELTKGIASYLGVEVPLAKGLLLDKQRAALRQAKTYKAQSLQVQANLINDLLFDAYISYWQWAAAWQLHKVYTGYLANARKRLDIVKIIFNNGDRAVADTIEAAAQLQNYELLKSEAGLLLNNRSMELSVFLWNKEEQPYVLSETYVPDTLQLAFQYALPDIEMMAAQLSSSHPKLLEYQYKLDMLSVERNLKMQNLLPEVNVKANILSKAYYEKISLNNGYLENNHKLALTVKVPLFLRQGRGEYKEAQLKIKETSLELSQRAWELKSKLKQYYSEAVAYRQQIHTTLLMSRNYQALLAIEELKFLQGESSLFLVNTRENKTLELRQKLIELQLKYLKSFYGISWSAGLLRK